MLFLELILHYLIYNQQKKNHYIIFQNNIINMKKVYIKLEMFWKNTIQTNKYLSLDLEL